MVEKNLELAIRIGFILLSLVLFPNSLFPDALPFKTGEVLKYNITLWKMTVGHSTMAITGTTKIDGTDCLIFETRAYGTPWINRFFKVDDRIMSYWDPIKKLPRYNEKKLHEGFFRRNHKVLFDLKEKTATWSGSQFSGNTDKIGVKNDKAVVKEKEGIYSNLPDSFQDILSAIYYQRAYSAEVELGKSFTIKLFDDLKLTDMLVKVLRVEKLNVTVNGVEKEFETVVVQPFIKTSGIFNSKGNIFIWISNDSLRIPVKITADIPIAGHVTVLLHETYLPGTD